MYKQAVTNADGELLGFDYIYDDGEDAGSDVYDDDPRSGYVDPPEYDTEDACKAAGDHADSGTSVSDTDPGLFKCDYCPGTFRIDDGEE